VEPQVQTVAVQRDFEPILTAVTDKRGERRVVSLLQTQISPPPNENASFVRPKTTRQSLDFSKEVVTAPRPLKPARQQEQPAPPPSPQELFALVPHRVSALVRYLTTAGCPWNTPPIMRDPEGGEDIEHYYNDVKDKMNKAPAILRAFRLFMPPIIYSYRIQDMPHLGISGQHKRILEELFRWNHSGSWRGAMTLFPWPFAESTNYGHKLDSLISVGSSALETHRRVVGLEGAGVQ